MNFWSKLLSWFLSWFPEKPFKSKDAKTISKILAPHIKRHFSRSFRVRFENGLLIAASSNGDRICITNSVHRTGMAVVHFDRCSRFGGETVVQTKNVSMYVYDAMRLSPDQLASEVFGALKAKDFKRCGLYSVDDVSAPLDFPVTAARISYHELHPSVTVQCRS